MANERGIMDPKRKMAVGSALAILSGTVIVLSALIGISSLRDPWGFVIGFLTGVCAGGGVALVIAGLVECRRAQ